MGKRAKRLCLFLFFTFSLLPSLTVEGPPIHLVWRREVGPMTSSPGICEEGIILGTSKKVLYLLRPRDGKVISKFKLKGHPASAPTCEGETIYISSQIEDGLLALGLRLGKPIWWMEIPDPLTQPLVGGARVWVGSGKGWLYCLASLEGRILWRFKADGPIYSNLLLDGEKVFFGDGDGHFYAVDVDKGELLWQFDASSSIISPPGSYRGGVYFGTYGGRFFAVDGERGEKLWDFQTQGSILSSPSFYQGRVFFGSNDFYLYCLEAESGRLCWKFKANGLAQIMH